MATPKLPLITPKKAVPGLPKIVPKVIVNSPPEIKPLVKVIPPVQRLVSGTIHNASRTDSFSNPPKDIDSGSSKIDEHTDGMNNEDSAASPGRTLAHAMTLSINHSDQTKLSRNNSLESQFRLPTKELSSMQANDTADNMLSNTVLKKIPSRSDANNSLEMGCTNYTEKEDNEIGYTPWMKIEERINQIRSLALNEFKNIAHNDHKELPKEGGLYDNYNTHYEDRDTWHKEAEHQLSYTMVQKLKDKKEPKPGKSNWEFINGFVKPRRKPFTSMSELSKHFQKNDSKDQHELVKLLLVCRDLEKTIEEQRTVLDMLDHDLREARGILPETLTDVNMRGLEGRSPGPKPDYPTSDIPLFIKGRVFLLPKDHKESGLS
ncbi:conserved hypothetical protein [Theileria equi strain WA]|uniref:Uncharacterized protein n=1 Tax=Theileria equi strain WA TaxID=1537102 RepID=L1LG77_THEEQ|nr:conserved hypothetical protein [Theileria equi strain WA]EKX74259.1 conserved hypothetical protein [Theileria equi strain WA]|eukprot:XP_004833711.1 conserved hypothetical protein [Theileria equi strain WA]